MARPVPPRRDRELDPASAEGCVDRYARVKHVVGTGGEEVWYSLLLGAGDGFLFFLSMLYP